MDYLSICAIVKDENSYLAEWIEYHKLIGVERFYIYDNESTIPISRTLESYVKNGIVAVTSFPGHAKQFDAYNHCLSEHGNKTFWMAFIDVDEFICPHKTDDLRSFLRDFESFAGVGLNWQVFGSSGHQVRPPGLQIEHFTMKAQPDLRPWNEHVKTIVHPPTADHFPNPHFCFYKSGFTCVNEKTIPFAGPFNIPVSTDFVQINHYITRSRSEFEEKMARGSADGSGRSIYQWMTAEQQFGQIRDESILRFAAKLKEAIPAAL